MYAGFPHRGFIIVLNDQLASGHSPLLDKSCKDLGPQVPKSQLPAWLFFTVLLNH